MVGLGSKHFSPKLKGQQFDSEAELKAALAARYNHPGLSRFGRWKARGKHWFQKKVRKNQYNTLKQEQEIILNAGAVSEAQGALGHAQKAATVVTAIVGVGAKVAGTAIGGPLGAIAGFALDFAMKKITNAATARLVEMAHIKASSAYGVLGSDKDMDVIELSAPAGFGGFIDESLEIKDEAQRAAIIKSLQKLAKKAEDMTKEQAESLLAPKSIGLDLLTGSPEEIAATLLWEGLKKVIAKGAEFAGSEIDAAGRLSSASAYRKL